MTSVEQATPFFLGITTTDGKIVQVYFGDKIPSSYATAEIAKRYRKEIAAQELGRVLGIYKTTEMQAEQVE
ncbi:MAG: hypothetical protein HYT72_01120 [Candidatus Aenigmarchaeota archaeon]|nr:hypothetical protein [Candidatus Aenigmarchaeota archaeon]